MEIDRMLTFHRTWRVGDEKPRAIRLEGAGCTHVKYSMSCSSAVCGEMFVT